MTEEKGGVIRHGSNETLSDLLAGGEGFLSRLTVMNALSEPVQSGQAVQGEYMLGTDTNLGKEFATVVGPWRPHAMVLDGGSVIAESFVTDDAKFIAIRDECNTHGRRDDRQPLYGVDYLFWIPTVKQFGVFFFNRTARREVPAFQALQSTPDKPTVGLMFSFQVVTKKYKWYVPKIKTYEGDVAALTMPEADQVEQAQKMFDTPKPQNKEEAPADGDRPR